MVMSSENHSVLRLLLALMVLHRGNTFSEHECKVTAKGQEYDGQISYTKSGRQCKKWTQTWYGTTNQDLATLFPYGDINHNFCRNPGGSKDRPWCVLENSHNNTWFEYCDIRFCPRQFTKTVCTQADAEMMLSCPYPQRGRKNLLYVNKALFGAYDQVTGSGFSEITSTTVGYKRKKRAMSSVLNKVFKSWFRSDARAVNKVKRSSDYQDSLAPTYDPSCRHFNSIYCTNNASVELYKHCMTKEECWLNAEVTAVRKCQTVSDYLNVKYECLPGSAGDLVDVCSDTYYETDTYGYLVSPRYPHRPYGSDLSCVCKLETTTDGCFEMDILDFDVEYEERCSYDYVSITTKDESKRICGKHEGRQLRIFPHYDAIFRFSSDESLPGRGFWIKFRSFALDGSRRPVRVSCGQYMTNASPGTPLFPFRSTTPLETESASTTVQPASTRTVTPSTRPTSMGTIKTTTIETEANTSRSPTPSTLHPTTPSTLHPITPSTLHPTTPSTSHPTTPSMTPNLNEATTKQTVPSSTKSTTPDIRRNTAQVETTKLMLSTKERPKGRDSIVTKDSSTTAQPATTKELTPRARADAEELNLGLIAGAGGGGLLVIVVLVVVVVVLCRKVSARTRKAKDEQKTDVYTNQCYSVKKKDDDLELSGPESKAHHTENESKERFDNAGDDNLYEVIPYETADGLLNPVYYNDSGYLDPQSIEVAIPDEPVKPTAIEKELLEATGSRVDASYLQLEPGHRSTSAASGYQDLGSQETNSYQALERNVSSNSHSYVNVEAIKQ